MSYIFQKFSIFTILIIFFNFGNIIYIIFIDLNFFYSIPYRFDIFINIIFASIFI